MHPREHSLYVVLVEVRVIALADAELPRRRSALW